MAPRTRLVRRAPLTDRVKAYLNPYDFLLWLSEELTGNDWEEFNKQWALPLGIALNIIFVLARANSTRPSDDDVFGDNTARFGSGWLSWLAILTTHSLGLFSIANAVYTFQRKRHYRLFEHAIDAPPFTPSARRVRVDSSPGDGSPLHLVSDILRRPASYLFTPESQPSSHALPDVWELAMWDPTAINLSLFCLFSPGHILLYWLFLPLRPLDPRPSVTIVTTFGLAALFSVHLTMMHKAFSQQERDKAIVNKQVQNEYDTKYVRPTINKPVRDVAIQTPPSKSTPHAKPTKEVETYTPTTFVNRGFHVNPNPDYSDHLTGQGKMPFASTPAAEMPQLRSPGPEFSSPLKGSTPGLAAQAGYRPSGTPMNGAYLGVYEHAQSPVRKAATPRVLDFKNTEGSAPRMSRGDGGTPDRRGLATGVSHDRVSVLKRGRPEDGRY